LPTPRAEACAIQLASLTALPDGDDLTLHWISFIDDDDAIETCRMELIREAIITGISFYSRTMTRAFLHC
jgi:hypothetical protein